MTSDSFCLPANFSADTAAVLLERVRAKRPRVHCITNAVAQELTANVLLASGAVPSMTLAPQEVEAFARSADALLINLGTLDDTRREAIPLALHGARSAGRPVVLDPVFIERSPVRQAFAQDLLNTPAHRPDLLKANPAEIAVLPEMGAAGPGADMVLVETGADDRLKQGRRRLALANGTPLLGRITATGCALGGLIGAFASVAEDRLEAAAAAVSVFNIAAELAAEQAQGPGTLAAQLLDQLYRITPDDLAERLIIADPDPETNKETRP